jgi:alkylhydroperoxidase family enzyme
MARITPVQSPYEPEVQRQLDSMMPEGTPPIGLFRTFVRNLPMTTAMWSWGQYELSRKLSLSMRDREIVIDRTCARCGCEYEWGVHVAFFAERVAFTNEQLVSITRGRSTDVCWQSDREVVLIELVDSLHDTSDIDDALWSRAAAHFTDRELLDITMLTGWYHAISFTARAARVDLEPGTPTFASLQPAR